MCYFLEINISFFYSSDSSVLPMSKELDNINVRVPSNLKKLIGRYLSVDTTYVNLSEFTRDALREKIKIGAPWIYEEMLRSKKPSTT